MKKRSGLFILGIVLAIPLSYLTFGDWMNFDTLSAVVFVVVMLFLIAKNKKVLDIDPMIKLGRIPIVYAVLWRTKFGLKFMDRVAEKHRGLIKFLGYCFIGLGFTGMVFISAVIIKMLFDLFTAPKVASEGVALVLPLTTIPGIGYLSFWHFIITLFVTVLIHEVAHGIVARAHNVPVKNSGLGAFSFIVPLLPAAFVEPDEKKLPKEKDIVQYSIFAAGPMINIIFAVIVLLFLSYAVNPLYENVSHPVGFGFGGLMENYSAQQVGMQPGMTINEVDGVEMLTYQSFAGNYSDIKPGDVINFGILNGSTYALTALPSLDNPDKGYLGIQNIINERDFNEDFADYGGAYLWLRWLVLWMFFINLAIGLMNLLPIIITDGGRMLKTALESILSNKEKAMKISSAIGLVFLFTLLAAAFLRYFVFGLFGFLMP